MASRSQVNLSSAAVSAFFLAADVHRRVGVEK